MKHAFNIVMIFILAATAMAVVFLLHPKQAEEANLENTSIVDTIVHTISPTKEPASVTFPFSAFDPSVVPQLEGDASTSKKIIADLNAMKIYLYTGNTLEKEIDIKSRGRSTTFWETPPGAYKVESKEENHYSSIGHVWMPYSMNFFGNYFIHGWPYYDNGAPVGEGYSGGCIRLTTDDAKIVYDFAKRNTPVYVFGIPQSASGTPEVVQSSYGQQSTTEELSATNYSIVNLSSGKVIDQKNEKDTIALGGLTHFMTAVISLELLNQYPIITVSDYNSSSSLEPGAAIEALDLLYPLLYSHDLRAADTIVNRMAPSWFVKNMNTKAKAIGMTSTTFTDALGVQENTSTTADLITFINYLYKHKSFLTTLTTTSQKETEYGTWTNSNALLDKTYFKGGLISTNTDSTTSAMLVLAKNNVMYGVVLINSTDITKDIETVLNKIN